MTIRIREIIPLATKERSLQSHYLEAANALVKIGIKNPVRVLRRLNKLGLIFPVTAAVNAGDPLIRVWARREDLGL